MKNTTARSRTNTKVLEQKWVRLDATGVYYRDLNQKIRGLVAGGARRIELNNVRGQRYIGTNLFGSEDRDEIVLRVNGTPGNDLAAFMDGPSIEVFGNAQDATGNTMNRGRVIIHGSAGDVLGYGMRGGEIFVRGNAGYRVGIHMKEYHDKVPTIVIGGSMQDFFGEYMAGGRIIVLNRFYEDNPPIRPSYFIGTGMHGGTILTRGDVESHQMGKEVGIEEPTGEERKLIHRYVEEFSRIFGKNDQEKQEVLKGPFYRLFPRYLRPYGRHYAY